MQENSERMKVRFASDGTECVAWHYPGTNGACVVMAAGGAVTKEPGTDRFARRFHADGFTVLAFDYRHLGESGGQPRQVIRMNEQLADLEAAIAYASKLPGVDPHRVAIWGFSLSGGHLWRAAARNPRLGAVIAQTPLADGLAAANIAGRHQRPLAMLRFVGRGIVDGLGGLFSRQPLLVPLAGAPGSVALLATPDGRDGDRALNPDNRYPEWQQVIAARTGLRISIYRPGRHASRITSPLLLLVCDQDQTAPPRPAVRAAQRASRAEVVRLPGGHYAPFLDSHEQAVEVELSFLRRSLLASARVPDAGARGRSGARGASRRRNLAVLCAGGTATLAACFVLLTDWSHLFDHARVGNDPFLPGPARIAD
ncbi:alpha/beta hydrolase [Nocardia sp. KC 131]|uniref:alpha/beta hydrolase n=1 Tax=Nocardia arseniciresistens TaxID=3392119 RepID=UPI00398F1D8E